MKHHEYQLYYGGFKKTNTYTKNFIYCELCGIIKKHNHPHKIISWSHKKPKVKDVIQEKN